MTLEQNYQDIVAGAITWVDYSKTRDMVGILAFVAVFLAAAGGAISLTFRGLTKKARKRLVAPHTAAPFIGIAAGLLVSALLYWRLAAPIALETTVMALLIALALWRFRPDRKLLAKLRPLQVGAPLFLFATFQLSYRYNDATESFGPSERGWILLSAAIAALMALSARHLMQNPNTAIAWPTFFSLGAVAAYVLPAWSPLHLDDFHLGELFTAWHQIADKGARPYVDFIPVQGTLGMLTGIWNHWIYDGKLGNYLIAKASVESLVGGLSLVLASRVLGLRLAFWLSPVLAVYPEGGDRLLLLLPFTLLILDPAVVARPSLRWPLWAGLGVLSVTYNLPSGFAWTIATGTALTASTLLNRPRWNLRQLVGGSVAVLALLVLTWNWVWGSIAFGLANGKSNAVAYGLGVIQPDTTHTLPMEWDHPAYRLSVEALRSGGWLLSMVFGGVFLFLAARGKKERSFQPFLFLGSICLLGPLLILPYSFGRIAAIGLSRTGVASLIFFGTFTLLGCLVALGRKPNSPL